MKSRTPIQMKCPVCRSLVKSDLLPTPQSVLNLPIRFPDAIPINGAHTLYYFYFDGVTVTNYEGDVVDLGGNTQAIADVRLCYNNPRMISNYRSGSKNGTTIVLDPHGSVLERIEYRYNQVHGTYKVYEHGQLIEMSTYAYGELHGPSSIYYTDYDRSVPRQLGFPPVEMVIQYENGRQTGDIYTYYENGNIDEVFPNEGVSIADGFNGTYKCYYPNGKCKVEMGFRDNVPHGPYTIYSKSGAILESGTFNEGKIEGKIFSRLSETVKMIRDASRDLTDTNLVIATMENPELYIQKVVRSNSAKRHDLTIHDIDLHTSIEGTVSGPDQRFDSAVVIKSAAQSLEPVFHHGICISTGC
jgi:antitoxin component YwqK of YwqJK toxin-antitoxin module